MWKLVGGKMVFVPMDEAGDEGTEGGGGAEGAGADDLPSDAGLSGGGGQELDDWMTPEARQAWDYDPFSPEEVDKRKKEKEKAAGGDGAEGAGGEEGEGKEEAGKEGEEQEKASEGAEGKEKENPELAQLREQNKQLQQMMENYQKLMEKQVSGQQEGKEEEGKEKDPLKEVPAYQPFQIPPQIKEMLFSDDPEKLTQGLGMMLQGVAQVTHMRVREEMSRLMDDRIAGTVDSKQRELTEKQKAENTQESIRKDWAETYPDLASEDLRPLVAHIGSQVAKEMGAQEWNETLRDAIAARVRKVLGRKEEASKGEGQEGAGKKKKPPFSASGSGRAPAPKGPDKTQQEIADVLGL